MTKFHTRLNIIEDLLKASDSLNRERKSPKHDEDNVIYGVIAWKLLSATLEKLQQIYKKDKEALEYINNINYLNYPRPNPSMISKEIWDPGAQTLAAKTVCRTLHRDKELIDIVIRCHRSQQSGLK